MIPEFNSDGNLPEGIYKANIDELSTHFAEHSARRKWLFEKLLNLISLVKSTGCLERLYLWGSFVSNKEFPNDIDLLLIMKEDFDLEQIDSEIKTIFDYTQAKIKYSADVFWAKSSIGNEVIELWLDTYQITRDFKRRGIVEVII